MVHAGHMFLTSDLGTSVKERWSNTMQNDFLISTEMHFLELQAVVSEADA